MRSLTSLLAAVLAVCLAACGTRSNPDFCCTTAVSCAASGTDVAVTPCDDPDRPVCDDDGQAGAPRTCIADTGGTCSAPGDCMDPARPYCIDNRCVQCQDGDSGDDCANPTPACNAATHLCGPCGGAGDCAGDPGGPVCANGSCVECGTAADCTAPGRGVCDPDTHACRGCRADDECASGVCHRDDGVCAPVGEVFYVDPTGSGTACTQAQPCATVAQALTTAGAGTATIKLSPGLHRGTVAAGSGRQLTIHGAGAGQTTLEYASAVPGTAFVSVDGGATLTLEGLKLTGASPTPAVQCLNATVRSFANHVDAVGPGGFEITRCSFALVDTAITRCGSAASNFGAVNLSLLSATNTARFEFDTLIGNSASGSNIAGVTCSSLATTVAIRSSIVFDNDGPPVTADPNCPVTYSVIDVAAPGATNTNVAPGLTAPAYHLTAGSSAEGRADPAATLDYDIDGELRPLGAGRDSGADER